MSSRLISYPPRVPGQSAWCAAVGAHPASTIFALALLARLLVLWRATGEADFLPESGDPHFYSEWARRIASPVVPVRRLIHELLCNIGKQHPQALGGDRGAPGVGHEGPAAPPAQEVDRAGLSLAVAHDMARAAARARGEGLFHSVRLRDPYNKATTHIQLAPVRVGPRQRLRRVTEGESRPRARAGSGRRLCHATDWRKLTG